MQVQARTLKLSEGNQMLLRQNNATDTKYFQEDVLKYLGILPIAKRPNSRRIAKHLESNVRHSSNVSGVY